MGCIMVWLPPALISSSLDQLLGRACAHHAHCPMGNGPQLKQAPCPHLLPWNPDELQPGKCLYTTIRELVENALDSAESIRNLPMIEITMCVREMSSLARHGCTRSMLGGDGPPPEAVLWR